MENSMNSMFRPSSPVGDETPEESSWTMYFQDFSNDIQMDGNSSSCYCSSYINYQTSSLLSDAACSAAGPHALDHKSCKKNRLSFKKRKNNGSPAAGFVDDDLEDTASSPVNSPKICNTNMENQFDKNLKVKDAMDKPQKNKGSGSSGQTDERNDETQLKKKGLCLVPLSMVVQYLG
ncbi:hypothetical protein E1A91_D01G083700v1 [Gossypium mustelinum]|uniref:Uncharacterized protein n=4 Tax=Gossypium TaxID=3633 RepID=A0A5J5SLM9_GOSBA|nr:hypothetical protein ES319_D01G078200v1 [Gossypium barbadense]PPD72430.1 hypothetical protein GOBAR_DD30655 [Gossypium barbadense]TYG82424.1 hypothetical protein ES288_D01G086700v1 [Gossypium darwinii]TYH86998.1 hypothetical protein ES332_D01G083900v1 [Gossypium tomentosum]TYI96591.1 hypothetical protein E1A91_D01G083700v1 [Gossypium mustelinum]